MQRPQSENGGIDQCTEQVFDEVEVGITPEISQGNEYAYAEDVEGLDDTQANEQLNDGFQIETGKTDYKGTVRDGQSEPVASFHNMDEFAFSAHKAAFYKAGKCTVCHAKCLSEVKGEFAHAIGNPI